MKICLRRMFHVVLTSKCACGSLTLQKKDTFFVSPDNRRLMRRKCKIRGLLDGFILAGKPWIAQKKRLSWYRQALDTCSGVSNQRLISCCSSNLQHRHE